MNDFKVEYISGGRAWCFCTFHDDKHTPNLSITLNGKYAGKWKCWACGEWGILDKNQKIVTLNTNKINMRPKTNWTKLQAFYGAQLNKLPIYKECLSKQLNVSIYSIDAFNVGYDGSAYTIPMYRDCGYISGLQRRFSDGNKCSVKGSKLGVFQSPYTGYYVDEPLFICEGFSDTISVHNLGYNTIGIPFCGFDLNVLDIILNDLGEGNSFEYIIIIPDNDDVGIKCADEIERLFGGEIFSFDGAKDIREYIKKNGKEAVKKELSYYA